MGDNDTLLVVVFGLDSDRRDLVGDNALVFFLRFLLDLPMVGSEAVTRCTQSHLCFVRVSGLRFGMQGFFVATTQNESGVQQMAKYTRPLTGNIT